jgi:type II secretory pathway pseudopilin PulG
MSLLEVVVVLVLTAFLFGVALPRMRVAAERAAVRGAVADIVATLSSARELAVAGGVPVSVSVGPAEPTLRVVRGADTLATRDLGRMFGVTVRASRDSLAYDVRGLGVGAANLTFLVLRGTTADTVTVSRLGRVRW